MPRRTMHGNKSPRADIVIWEMPKAKAANKTPVLVIECKAENIDVNIKDYYQSENYSRAVGCISSCEIPRIPPGG